MMRSPVRFALLFSMIALAPAAATPPAISSPVVSPPAPMERAALYMPGHYVVDSEVTKVHFQVKALVGGYAGDFLLPEGAVVIDPARPDRATVDVRFPVEKLTTGDKSTDAMLKGGSFFDMAEYPTVRFTAQDAPLVKDDAPTPIAGELTMHGQARPVTLSVRLIGTTPDEAPGLSVLHFTGMMTVNRSDYDMGFGRPFVSDKVELAIDAIFRRS